MARSKRTKQILLGIGAACGIGIATIAFTGIGSQTMNTAKLELISTAVAHGGWKDSHGGWKGRGGRHSLSRLCSDERTERLNDAIGFVEAFFSFNEAQNAAWTDLASDLRTGSDIVGRHCGDMKSGSSPATAPEKLGRVETFLNAGLDIVRQVRPSFERFYGTLDESQKAAIDKMVGRHRR